METKIHRIVRDPYLLGIRFGFQCHSSSRHVAERKKRGRRVLSTHHWRSLWLSGSYETVSFRYKETPTKPLSWNMETLGQICSPSVRRTKTGTPPLLFLFFLFLFETEEGRGCFGRSKNEEGTDVSVSRGHWYMETVWIFSLEWKLNYSEMKRSLLSSRRKR